jgi:hypothetical protein
MMEKDDMFLRGRGKTGDAGISAAMARVASRFYLFGILLVGSTFYLHHGTDGFRAGLAILAVPASGMAALLYYFPWDRFPHRVFTFVHVIIGAALTAVLISFTGGAHSSYYLLYFLIIFFSYYCNLPEMLAISAIVSLFYLIPFLSNATEPFLLTTALTTVLFFFLGAYILFGLTNVMLRQNRTLKEFNERCLEIASLTGDVLKDVEKGASLDSIMDGLKDRLPTSFCVIMLLEGDNALVTRCSCAVRNLTWKPVIGASYSSGQLVRTRVVLETRQPRLFTVAADELDDELKELLPNATDAVLAVPIRIGAENGGVMIFGEERSRERMPFSLEVIRLSIAMSKQAAAAVQLWKCYERLSSAGKKLDNSRDEVIRAERLAALGEVTRAVEHAINNPLSVIVNWSEIYREDAALDPEIRKKFQVMYEMAMRITEVIRNLTALKEDTTV